MSTIHPQSTSVAPPLRADDHYVKYYGTPYITEDLISNILICLPVKPLLRFRCVSKPRCSLIDSTKFVKGHLQRSIECNPDTGLIFTDFTEGNSFYLVELDSFHDSTAEEIADPPKSYLSGADFVGSCNGLVCLCKNLTHDTPWWNPEILLWNPATKKGRQLPSANDSITMAGPYGSIFVGFGYDHLNDDYKVVRTSASQLWGVKVTVYSLKSNSWTAAETLYDETSMNYTNLSGTFGRFADGSLYWLATNVDGDLDSLALNESHFIFAFDLGVERHRELQFPAGVTRNDENDMSLIVFNRCVCLIDFYGDSCTNIWLMNDNGVDVSWSKLLSVEQPGKLGSLHIVPLAFSKTRNDYLLAVDGNTIMWYDHLTKKVKNVKIHGIPDPFTLLVYMESLVQLSYDFNLDGKESKGKRRNYQSPEGKESNRRKRKKQAHKNKMSSIKDDRAFVHEETIK